MQTAFIKWKSQIRKKKNKLEANDWCKNQFGLFDLDFVNWASRINSPLMKKRISQFKKIEREDRKGNVEIFFWIWRLNKLFMSTSYMCLK